MQASIDTRQRIVNAAKTRFHSRSYGDVGVKEICDSAEVQKGSFYHFFPSKRDLAIAVIEEFADDWATGFIAEAFDPKLPPMERFDYLIDAAYFWQKAARDIQGHLPGCLFGNLALEISTQDDILRAKLNAVFIMAKKRIMETLDEAVAEGSVEPLDSENSAEAMLAYLEGLILLAKTQNNPDVIHRLGKAIKSIRIETNSL